MTDDYLGSTMSHWDFGQSADERPADGSGPTDASPADDDGWDDDLFPYPLTYERDEYYAPPSAPPVPPAREAEERWVPGPRPGPPGDAEPGGPDLGGPDLGAPDPGAEAWSDWERGFWDQGGQRDPDRRDPGAEAWADWERDPRGGRRDRDGRRWMLPAAVAVAAAALGVTAVLLATGHPTAAGTAAAPGSRAASGSAAPSASPAATPGGTAGATTSPAASAAAPLTLAQARQVLAGYTTDNNDANAAHSDALLATVETGSSYAVDAGLYQAQQATGAAPFPAFSPLQATYYLPGDEPATGPRWFVVQVANAFNSSPEKVSSTEYVLFTQSAPGTPWLDAIEPYLLSGAGAPQVTVGSDGLATAVSPGDSTDAVAPGQLSAATAAALDAATGQAAITAPGNLADRADQRLAQQETPGGTVTDTHTPAPGTEGQEFALLTNGGGALVFYNDAAELTITPPAGSLLHLTVPGLYSASQSLSRAGLSYLEQFAAYDPPAGHGGPRIVADYSGITGKN
jgi:hypothetical protein